MNKDLDDMDFSSERGKVELISKPDNSTTSYTSKGPSLFHNYYEVAESTISSLISRLRIFRYLREGGHIHCTMGLFGWLINHIAPILYASIISSLFTLYANFITA
jgi:hypothetical protein